MQTASSQSTVSPDIDTPDNGNSKKINVSSGLLLSLYATVPLSLLIVIADLSLFDGSIRQVLPTNPGQLILWAIIFNFPHIVSSLVTLADAEYISYYKARFSKALMIISLAVLFMNIAVPLIFPANISLGLYGLFFIFFAGYTMYHVLSQQFGIGTMLARVKPSIYYEFWRYSGAVAATAMYMLVFAKPNFESVSFGAYSLYQATQALAGVFVLISAGFGLYLLSQSQRKIGGIYIASNISMLIVTWICCMLEYSFFVILIPRFVHDVTALIIYSVHDHNRNLVVKRNYIYKWLSFLPIPILVLCPLVAIALANTVECGTYLLDFGLGFNPIGGPNECALSHVYAPTVANPLPFTMQIGMQVLFICGLFHYHIESFVWKREAIHRHSVSFT